MEKGQTRKLSYDELESDEKLLLKWYRENPLSVYIEIALIALEELEVITKNEYRKYKAETEKKQIYWKHIGCCKGERIIMHKDDLKDFLFDILNEHDTIFTDLSLDDETDTIFIKSVDGENFIVTVSPVTADEALIELWAKKNPELMSLALGVLNMRDLGEFTEEETHRYLSEIVGKANNSFVKDIKNRLGKLGNDKWDSIIPHIK